jgi:threonine dehydrogenase-like Zn-dependent dehydrogenase
MGNASASALTARIVRLLGPRQLVWDEETLPESPPSDALLCRTYPRVQGYCNVAEVLAVGGAVTSHAPGDRVLSFSSHRSHFLLPAADALLTVPATVPTGQAAVTYLFHLGYNALLRSGVQAGHRVAVLGLGALGLGTVAVAALAGAEVLAVTSHEAAWQLASSFGAAEVRDRGHAREREDWADVVVVTTNAWGDLQLALQMTGHRGTIAVLGFPGRETPPGEFNPLDSRYFYTKQLRIEAVGLSPERPDARGFTRFNERDNLAWLLGRIATGALPAAAMIAGSYPAEKIVDAYEALLARRQSPVTCVLEWA